MKYFINWLRFLVTEPDVASVRMMSTWLLSDLQTKLYFSMLEKKMQSAMANFHMVVMAHFADCKNSKS